MANIYELNTVVNVTATFTDPSTGAKRDPSVVTLDVESPDTLVNTLSLAAGDIVRDSAGRFKAQITADQIGIWFYRFTAEDGADKVVATESFVVVEEHSF